ncbi:WD repeat-containing protein 18 [Pectinophora gossypiella]|nr:WD repeat-containing protein 18 [Pectinophora gossypiella]
MANLLEVLVTCDSNNTLWSCSVWDPHTGTSLMSYKGGGTAQSKTLSFIGSDYLAAVEKTKPVLHVWPLNSQQTVQGMRFILPGKASAFAFTQDGSFCVAGIDEKIYLWQVSSGSLLTILNRHYQKVVMLKFTPDGKYFISAAEDGMVMVWSLTTIAAHPEVELVTQQTAGQHDPVYMFSDHSLPVTDLCVSKTGIHGRLCTVSSDRTFKIYDLATGTLLLNVVFDAPLSSVTMDVLELNCFIGTTEGKIHQLNLTNAPRNRDVVYADAEKNCPTFKSHTKAVTCLSVSLDGETLMSGSNDDQIILWHIRSKQPTRIIQHKGPITNAFFSVNYPAIYKLQFSPNIVLHSLDRSMEKEGDEVPELEILTNKNIEFWPKQFETESDSNTCMPSEQKHDDKMLQEMEKLKKINANLYALSIERALNFPLINTGSNKKRKEKK